MKRILLLLALMLSGCATYRAPLPSDLPSGHVIAYLTHGKDAAGCEVFHRIDGECVGDRLYVNADALGGDAWWWDYCQVGRVFYDTTTAVETSGLLVLRAEAILR